MPNGQFSQEKPSTEFTVVKGRSGCSTGGISAYGAQPQAGSVGPNLKLTMARAEVDGNSPALEERLIAKHRSKHCAAKHVM
jgi:hypothetical protein